MLLPYLNKELIEAGCDEAGAAALPVLSMPQPLFFPKILRTNC